MEVLDRGAASMNSRAQHVNTRRDVYSPCKEPHETQRAVDDLQYFRLTGNRSVWEFGMKFVIMNEEHDGVLRVPCVYP